MTNKFGKYYSFITFGESHGKAVGCVIDGIRPGIIIDQKYIQKLLDNRRPGKNKLTTQRKEEDKMEILSGVFEGKTTGHPICLIIWNKDAISGHYDNIKNLFRPGHADLTFYKKYGVRDHRGGGRQSARVLAANVAAGAIAKRELSSLGVKIVGYVKQIGKIKAINIDLKQIYKNNVYCPDKDAALKAEKLIMKTKGEGNSLGCMLEVMVTGVPLGWGAPQANKLNAEIAKALMSINAAKAVEIGAGFEVIDMLGSKNNDIFINKGNKILTKTNNSGGILGGISNGMPIVARVTIKPASSIYKPQTSINTDGKKVKFNIRGRHDPCPGIRAVPIIETMMATVLYNAYLEYKAMKG